MPRSLTMLRAGDHMIFSRQIYGSVQHLIEDVLRSASGIETTFVDITDHDAVDAAFRANTRLLHVETIANPTLDRRGHARPDRARPRARRPGHGRQHVRVALPVPSGGAGRRLDHGGPDQVDRRPLGRPGRLCRRLARSASSRSAASRSTPAAGSRRSARSSSCAASRRSTCAWSATPRRPWHSPSCSRRATFPTRVWYPGLPSHPQHDVASAPAAHGRRDARL